MHYENGIVSFKMGVNKYSDLSDVEITVRMNGHKANSEWETMNNFYFYWTDW